MEAVLINGYCCKFLSVRENERITGPHRIVECSSDLERRVAPSTLVDVVFQGALENALFDVNDIKVLATAYENHKTGSGVSDFVHIIAKFLFGRTLQQRSQLA